MTTDTPTDATGPRGLERPSVGDIWLAGMLTLVFGFMPIPYGGVGVDTTWTLVPSVLLGLVQLIALVWRRVHPQRVTLIVAIGAVAHFALGQFLQPSDIAVLVALYSVTAFGKPGSSRIWVMVAMGGAALVGAGYALSMFDPAGTSVGLGQRLANGIFFFIGCAALALTSWALGLIRRARFLQQQSLAERAARLERERDQLAQIATQAERTRIAREMHDIVAHSLSVVIAQADGGRYAAKTSPEAAERALTTISETGRAALADMRRILGVLRTDGGQAELVPQPADTDVAALVASMKDTMSVSLIEMGTARPLPPGTGATIYRIAQESLTNILKHAGPSTTATVMLQWAPTHVILQVDDDGRGAAATSDGAGHGVLGMRERAAMLGGTLTAGPKPGGGYRVRAEIPVPASHGSAPADGPPATPPAPVYPYDNPRTP